MEGNMDWDHIARNWQQFDQRVRAKWGKLTDADLATIDRTSRTDPPGNNPDDGAGH
jgi:hypothetical protein